MIYLRIGCAVLLAAAAGAVISLSGCSSMARGVDYLPVESPGWDVVNRHKYYEKVGNQNMEFSQYAKASFLCNNQKIETREFKGNAIGGIGPPVIPIIPVFDVGSAYLVVNYGKGYVNPRVGKNCPMAAIDDGPYQSASGSGYYDYECRYDVDVGNNDFKIKISSKDMQCDIPPLKFRHEGNWNYAPFIVPHT